MPEASIDKHSYFLLLKDKIRLSKNLCAAAPAGNFAFFKKPGKFQLGGCISRRAYFRHYI
jgi:hypothetical protein